MLCSPGPGAGAHTFAARGSQQEVSHRAKAAVIRLSGDCRLGGRLAMDNAYAEARSGVNHREGGRVANKIVVGAQHGA
jgi:hypothetical protein